MVVEMVIVVVFGCYIISSLLLFKYPKFLHKKKDVKFISQHISHRGGAGENYENTMSAFKHAVEIGTDMLELDVHLTKDRQVIVSHDPNVDKRTEYSGAISDFNYDELPTLKETIPIDFMPGKTFCSGSSDRRIPLLEDVFRAFPTTPVNVDIKIDNDELITKVGNLVKQYNREHITVWGNMKNEITLKCFKENPNIGLFFSVKRVTILVLLLYSGILPFIPLKETHLEIFLPMQLLKIYGEKHKLKWWHVMVARVVNFLLIRPFLFHHLSERGIHTYLWVLNTEEEFNQAFELGVTGVMTDYPTKLKAFLDESTETTL